MNFRRACQAVMPILDRRLSLEPFPTRNSEVESANFNAALQQCQGIFFDAVKVR